MENRPKDFGLVLGEVNKSLELGVLSLTFQPSN